jgi:glutathione S-transferase
MSNYTLISHKLCPYVQRAAIVFAEKEINFERKDIDLANKPDWFLQLSPLGKTPILLVDQQPIFESAVICEYLDEVLVPQLHPNDPLTRAQHRSWMEFGSAILNTIGGFYSAPNRIELEKSSAELMRKFEQLENVLDQGPYFAGSNFSMVDAVFGPIFRYFDLFDAIAHGIFVNTPKVTEWRRQLAQRASIRNAVSPDYIANLKAFINARNSELGRLLNP